MRGMNLSFLFLRPCFSGLVVSPRGQGAEFFVSLEWDRPLRGRSGDQGARGPVRASDYSIAYKSIRVFPPIGCGVLFVEYTSLLVGKPSGLPYPRSCDLKVGSLRTGGRPCGPRGPRLP